MDITLTDCEKKLSQSDLEKVEKELSVTFPESFKIFYSNYNGGEPNRSVWIDPRGKFDYIELRMFEPMLYKKDFDDDPNFTLNGRTVKEWAEGKLPPSLVPFAVDWGANYFCIHHTTGEIFYYVCDTWSDNLTREKNFEVNTQFLSDSFSDFLTALIINDGTY